MEQVLELLKGFKQGQEQHAQRASKQAGLNRREWRWEGYKQMCFSKDNKLPCGELTGRDRSDCEETYRRLLQGS